MPELGLHHILFYDYVENIVERRAPHREGHLTLLRDWKQEGKVVMGGVMGDPPQTGVIVFRVNDPAEVERYVSLDPYVAAGLVEGWRVEPWNVGV